MFFVKCNTSVLQNIHSHLQFGIWMGYLCEAREKGPLVSIQAYFYGSLMQFSKHRDKHNFRVKRAILLSIATLNLDQVYAYKKTLAAWETILTYVWYTGTILTYNSCMRDYFDICLVHGQQWLGHARGGNKATVVAPRLEVQCRCRSHKNAN